ncbi:MAG TPA: hypothetical protein DCW59_15185 [Alteromonas sp.]|jgi:hypothetical protein|nr:hypothetical protein [Alteromonas sp.]|tara:strand:+ start:204 stop:458 length:255 start_codon:yes stop_codon:yes gene_type:complete
MVVSLKISARAYSLAAAIIIVVVAMIAVNYITASYNQLVVGDLKINQREVATVIKNEYALYWNNIVFLNSIAPISGVSRTASAF